MCGLVGILGTPTKKMVDAFTFMLNIDVVRGPDSTGVIAVGKDNVFTHKDVLLPPDFISEDEYKKKILWKPTDHYYLIGHNRKATKGVINQENAHPFQHGPITLVHNGTLHTNIRANSKTFGTDSESIAHGISVKGIRWVWERLNGAAAVIFHDSRSDRINLINNGKRPLFWCWEEGREHLLIASETWMITSAADRYHIDLETRKNDSPKIYFPQDDALFQFQYDPATKKFTDKSRQLTKYEPPVSVYRQGSYSSVEGASVGGHMTSPWNQAAEDRRIRDEINRRFESHSSHTLTNAGYFSPKDLKMPLKEFREEYPTCCFCKETLTAEYETSAIIDDRRAVCENCFNDAEEGNINLKAAADGI